MTDDTVPRWQRAAVAVVLAGAVGAFLLEGVWHDLSITVRALLLLGTVVAFLAGAAASQQYQSGLGLCLFVALVAFVGYAVVEFPLAPLVVVLLVVGSTSLLGVVTFLLHERRLAISPKAGQVTFLALVLVAAVLVGVDLQVGSVQYDVALHEEVSLGNDTENVTRHAVGEVTATNTFVFREQVDFPGAHTCVYTGDGRHTATALTRFGNGSYPASVAGNGAQTAEMVVAVDPEVVAAVDDPLPVERAASCPDASAEQRIVVVLPP